MAEGPAHVTAGRISSAHGLDGSVKVAQPVPPLLNKGSTVWIDGVERVIERRSGTDAKPIIRLSGCTSRNDSDALRGAVMTVPRSDVPDLGDDEWWVSDLVGCQVSDGEVRIGTVTDVLGLPSCEALQVEREVGGVLLVPVIGDALRNVDLKTRSIDINLQFLGESA